MLDTHNNTGWYAGLDCENRLIPTPEFRRSLARAFGRNYKEPACFSNPIVHPWRGLAFDAAPGSDRAARLHRALDRILDKLEQRGRTDDDRGRRDSDSYVASDENESPTRGALYGGELQPETGTTAIEKLDGAAAKVLKRGNLEEILSHPGLGVLLTRLQHERKMRAVRKNNEALARKTRQLAPLGSAPSGPTGAPPGTAYDSQAPASDLERFQRDAASTRGEAF